MTDVRMQGIELKRQWDRQTESAHGGGTSKLIESLVSSVAGPWPVSAQNGAGFAANVDLDFLEIRAAEQRKIGCDLHDCLGPHLTGTAFKAKLLEQTLADISPELARAAQEVVNLINAGIDQVRRLARGLDPVDVEAAGLDSALARLADDTRKVFGIPCVFRCTQTVPRLDPAMNLQLYRIAQEALHNALKHGTAKSIEIELAHTDEDQISLRIADDGRGFPQSESSRGGNGMGLRIMKRRAQVIGGCLTIESQPKRGTRITCAVQIRGQTAKPANDACLLTARPLVGALTETVSPESEAR